MSHHHHSHHSHGDSASHGKPSELDKLAKILDHWIHHIEDHARSYQEWALKAKDLGKAEVSAILEQAASESRNQKESMEKALALLKGE